MTAPTAPSAAARTAPPPGLPSRGLAAPALLALAADGLAEAAGTALPGRRYALAHLAALRAAAAVLACRARPVPVGPGPGTDAPGPGPTGSGPARARSGRRPTSAWVLLAGVAPELAEWAAFFAAGARKRAAAEAGLTGVVTPREADDLLRDAHSFLAVVGGLLPETCAPARQDGLRHQDGPRHRDGRARTAGSTPGPG